MSNRDQTANECVYPLYHTESEKLHILLTPGHGTTGTKNVHYLTHTLCLSQLWLYCISSERRCPQLLEMLLFY